MKKLEPGYELDLLVSREIYGIRFPTRREVMAAIGKLRKKSMMTGGRYWSRTDSSRPWGFHYWMNRHEELEYKLEVANVSQNLDAAFQLVGFMRKDSFHFNMSQSSAELLCGYPEGYSRVSFTCPFGPCKKHGNKKRRHHGAYDVAGDTLPMAIVKAALIAKKVTWS